MIAALFVRKDGPYFGRDDVDPWDADRDATRYTGPHRVVAHPPGARWGRFWWSDGSKEPGRDGGLFSFALSAVRKWGGVLEHPEASHAFRRFDLGVPARGAWSRNIWGDWLAEISQSAYGHRARKKTWLLAHGFTPCDLDWSDPAGTVYLAQSGRCSRDRPRRTCHCPRCVQIFGTPERVPVERMGKAECELTPPLLAQALIELAGTP